MSEESPEIFKNLRQRLQEMPALTKIKERTKEIRNQFQDRQGEAGGTRGKGILQKEGTGLGKVLKEHAFQVRKDGVSDPVSRMASANDLKT